MRYDSFWRTVQHDTFDKHLPVLFSFTDVEVFSGKMSKLIMKQLSEELLDKYDYVFWSVTEIPLNKWNCDVKHWYFLIIDNSIDNHLKTQNAGLIGHINFLWLQ